MSDNKAFEGDDKYEKLELSATKGAPGLQNASTSQPLEDKKQNDLDEPSVGKEENGGLPGSDVAVVVVEPKPVATKPYAGMGKEDLLRFSDTPFWNRFRMTCVVIFWLGWLALLGAVIGLTIVYPRCKPVPEQTWWQKSVFYQVYVRSFYDNNGDGIGDLEGVQNKLSYFQEINADGIILGSIYKGPPSSSNPDFGYEVEDHTAIDPDYGTMADFENLLAAAHDQGLKVILDFIPNFTGVEHLWFMNSMAATSPANPYWNYYVWTPHCTENTTANNWMSVLGGSAWKYHSTRGECYYHAFLENQPELNLRSSSVLDELEAILKFWLDKGVDGFRVNNAQYLFEDSDLRDDLSIPGCTPATAYSCFHHNFTTSQPEVYDVVARWRTLLDEYTNAPDGRPRVLLTDAHVDISEAVKYYGTTGRDGAHLPLNYEPSAISDSCDGKCVLQRVDNWIYNMPADGTATWLTGSQDKSRIQDKIGNGLINSVLMLTMTLPGAAITYYGEEVGMGNNANVPSPSKDPWGRIDTTLSRDPYRTPMHWDSSSNGGFVNTTNGNSSPWLPVGADRINKSVEYQKNSSSPEDTPWKLYTSLSALRKDDQAFFAGHFYYAVLNDNIVSYIRYYEGSDRYLVALNFGSVASEDDYTNSHYLIPGDGEVAFTTRADMTYKVGDSVNLRTVTLQPHDGIVFKWSYSR